MSRRERKTDHGITDHGILLEAIKAVKVDKSREKIFIIFPMVLGGVFNLHTKKNSKTKVFEKRVIF